MSKMLANSPAAKPTPKNKNTYQNPFDYSSIAANLNLKSVQNEYRKDVMEKTLKDNATMLKCKSCSSNYPNKKTIIEHYELHKKLSEQTDETNEIITDKPICECGLENPHNQHKIKEFICFECNEQFSKEYYYRFHMAEHCKNFSCCVCKDFSATTQPQLISHLKEIHSPDGTSQFYCNECEKYFISQSCFDHHKTYHAKYKNLFCDLCKIFLPTTSMFKTHAKRAHKISSSGRFACTECNFTFSKGKYLQAHNKHMHDASKHLCNVCGKVFARPAGLSKHMKIHEVGKFICSVCGNRLKNTHDLAMHTRIHTGEKPNKCSVCAKSFTQKSTLVVHMRTHTGEKPYPCEKCKKGFITKAVRDAHRRTCI